MFCCKLHLRPYVPPHKMYRALSAPRCEAINSVYGPQIAAAATQKARLCRLNALRVKRLNWLFAERNLRPRKCLSRFRQNPAPPHGRADYDAAERSHGVDDLQAGRLNWFNVCLSSLLGPLSCPLAIRPPEEVWRQSGGWRQCNSNRLSTWNPSLRLGWTAASPRLENQAEKLAPWAHNLSSPGHVSVGFRFFFQSNKSIFFACFYASFRNHGSSFLAFLKVSQSHLLDPVTLTELMVVLINIMYQHPGPLPGDTSQTGGDSTLTHTHPHLHTLTRTHVIDFGPPPRFLTSPNKQPR